RDVGRLVTSEPSNISSMFNGWPATYGDIVAGFTFRRTCVTDLVSKIEEAKLRNVVIVGASGVGKTTAARQILHKLASVGMFVWEHDSQSTLIPEAWLRVAAALTLQNQSGVLMVDDASAYMTELNILIDGLAARTLPNLKLVIVSAKANWAPRIKSV